MRGREEGERGREGEGGRMREKTKGEGDSRRAERKGRERRGKSEVIQLSKESASLLISDLKTMNCHPQHT